MEDEKKLVDVSLKVGDCEIKMVFDKEVVNDSADLRWGLDRLVDKIIKELEKHK